MDSGLSCKSAPLKTLRIQGRIHRPFFQLALTSVPSDRISVYSRVFPEVLCMICSRLCRGSCPDCGQDVGGRRFTCTNTHGRLVQESFTGTNHSLPQATCCLSQIPQNLPQQPLTLFLAHFEDAALKSELSQPPLCKAPPVDEFQVTDLPHRRPHHPP